MKHTYDLLIKATIEIGGKWEADTAAEAIEMAKGELRDQGEISDIDVDRMVMLDEEEAEV